MHSCVPVVINVVIFFLFIFVDGKRSERAVRERSSLEEIRGLFLHTPKDRFSTSQKRPAQINVNLRLFRLTTEVTGVLLFFCAYKYTPNWLRTS